MNNDWMIYIFLVILCWGTWTFLPKVIIRTISAESALVLGIIGTAFCGMIVLFFISMEFHPLGSLCALSAGFCNYLGAYYYFRSVRANPVGLVSSISSLYPVVAVVLSVLLLGERASPRRVVGIALAIAAIYLMNLPRIEGEDCEARSRSGVDGSTGKKGG
ncbi:MAG: DMT family transporter [Deltaproteobacteria bacterium]|nr:DMT family transporter [Deltaproteobacteria bacterium]